MSNKTPRITLAGNDDDEWASAKAALDADGSGKVLPESNPGQVHRMELEPEAFAVFQQMAIEERDEEIQALQAEINRLKSMVEWMPIESCPKTKGMWADLFVQREEVGRMRLASCQWTGGGWLHPAGGAFIPEEVITHWRLTPPAPGTEAPRMFTEREIPGQNTQQTPDNLPSGKFEAVEVPAEVLRQVGEAFELMMPWAEQGFYGGGSPEENAQFAKARAALKALKPYIKREGE